MAARRASAPGSSSAVLRKLAGAAPCKRRIQNDAPARALLALLGFASRFRARWPEGHQGGPSDQIRPATSR